MNPRPKKVEILADYKLKVLFSNGEKRIYDMSRLFQTKIYAPLRDLSLFRTARVTDDEMTIEWANELDICPDELYTNSEIIYE